MSPTLPKTIQMLVLTSLVLASTLQAAEIRVENGNLEGGFQDGVHRFLGVPFAAPPVGELRWRDPQQVTDWTGVRSATDFGPNCMQLPYPESLPYYRPMARVSEDCLYLNVWTKQLQSSQPVIVWIHGGSLTRGSGSNPVYDGTHFADKDIVLVTINYRLNVFGYLAHPQLSTEQDGYSGNYGTMDQIQALKWVRENISAFGGDPENVTIAGQSAGGWSVSHLMSSPLATGLFHKAIGQSGASMSEIGVLKGPRGAETRSGLTLQEVTGAKNLAALRELDADTILQAFAGRQDTAAGGIVDGKIIPEQPQILFREGRFNQVDLLLGYTQDEAIRVILP